MSRGFGPGRETKMKPFIESGDAVQVIIREGFSVTGTVAQWPSRARPTDQRVIHTEFCTIELGQFEAVMRFDRKDGND